MTIDISQLKCPNWPKRFRIVDDRIQFWASDATWYWLDTNVEFDERDMDQDTFANGALWWSDEAMRRHNEYKTTNWPDHVIDSKLNAAEEAEEQAGFWHACWREASKP